MRGTDNNSEGVSPRGKEGVVAGNSQGQDYVCTSPAGTFNWTQFSSVRHRSGALLPETVRIVLTDNNPHEFEMRIENSWGSGGLAWIDDIELVSPSGQVQSVLGQFNVTPMDNDTAWYNRANGNMWGERSLLGARNPVVRGETGVDFAYRQDWNRDLSRDTKGIWLHNNIWGQVNDSGMYELSWWSKETIPSSLYYHFLNFRNFMGGMVEHLHYHQSYQPYSNSDIKWLPGPNLAERPKQ